MTKTLGLSDAALAKRKNYLTASDVGAVLGVDPYRDPYTVWLSKSDVEMRPEEVGPAAKLGQALEAGLIDYAINDLGAGHEILHNQWRVADNKRMGATIDAQTKDSKIIFEAKTTGLFNKFAPSLDDWGEAGTDQVPAKVAAQTSAQLLCDPRAEMVIVVALIPGRGPVIYQVPRIQGVIDAIEDECLAWWDTFVVGNTPPPIGDTPPKLDVLKRIVREPASTVPISFDLVNEYLKSKDHSKQVAAVAKQKQAVLLAALGEAEGGVCDEGTFVYRRESAGIKLSTKVIKEKEPEIFERYAEQTYRMMPRWKVRKGGE